MSRITAIANHKGGCAKTTSAVNVAACWAREGRRVLIVDLDQQGAVAAMFGHPRSPGTPGALIAGQPVESLVVHDAATGVDILPSDLHLAGAIEALRDPSWQRRLGAVLEPVRERYDEIVIDVVAGLARPALLALAAADRLVIPSLLDTWTIELSVDFATQVSRLRTSLGEDGAPLCPEIRIAGILLAAVRGNRTSERIALSELAERIDIPVLMPPVPDREIVRQAIAASTPVVVYAPESDAAEAYREIALGLLADAPVEVAA